MNRRAFQFCRGVAAILLFVFTASQVHNRLHLLVHSHTHAHPNAHKAAAEHAEDRHSDHGDHKTHPAQDHDFLLASAVKALKAFVAILPNTAVESPLHVSVAEVHFRYLTPPQANGPPSSINSRGPPLF